MSRAYGFGMLNMKYNTLNNLLSGGAFTPTLQQVLDTGDTAQGILTINASPGAITNQMRYDTQIISDAASNTAVHQTDGFVATNQPFGLDYGQLKKDRVIFQKGATLIELINNGTELDVNGQVDFNNAPHAPDPINGNDLANKGYVDSLVGQYSGGFNFFLNYSVVDGIYRSLGQSVVAAAQQIVPITTNTTNQLVAEFVSSALGITSIPSGIWNVLVFSEVAAIGGILTYFFEVYQLVGAIETLIFTSGNSTDVNATTTPTAFGINGTLTAPYTLALTDKIVIKIYLHKDGAALLVNTYFQNAYYSFVQSTLNAGTTLLSSNNTFTGTNKFTLGITVPSLDRETAAALNIGATTASALNLGRAAITTFVAGTLQSSNIDRATGGAFSIGATNATSINLNSKGVSNFLLGTNEYINVGTPTTAPTINQIGYKFKLTNFYLVDTAMTTNTDFTVVNTANFPAGTWIIAGGVAVNPAATTTIQSVSMSMTQAGNNIFPGGNAVVGVDIYPFISGTFFSSGTTTLQVILRIRFLVSTCSIRGGQTFFNIYATRIS